jgi:hypothetical protein
MAFLKEDGSLDVERISSLPLDEFINVVENLTQEQWKEFIDKCEPYNVKGPVVPIVVDYPIEEDGVDADVLLEELRKKCHK